MKYISVLSTNPPFHGKTTEERKDGVIYIRGYDLANHIKKENN